MSRSTLQAIWPGDRHENIREFPNSWGTAPIVWDTFCARYLHRDPHWWALNGSREEGKEMWGLWKDARIPESHRAVFLFTLDNIYVSRKDYRRFTVHLREFLESAQVSANRVNHWPLIAQAFEMDPDYPALSLWCTSVTSDPWVGPYDEDEDEWGAFDWSKAYDLYSELESLADAGAEA